MAIVEHVLMVKVRGNSDGGGRTDAAGAVKAIDSALRMNGYQCEITEPGIDELRSMLLDLGMAAARIRDLSLDLERKREAWEQLQDELNDSTMPPYRPELHIDYENQAQGF